jgi:hypothetical protein
VKPVIGEVPSVTKEEATRLVRVFDALADPVGGDIQISELLERLASEFPEFEWEKIDEELPRATRLL